jgi:hypothetical protein
MWKNTVELDRPQMIIWSMHIASWIPTATNTHSEYVLLIAFSTATLAAEKHLDVKLYIHCLPYAIL